MESVRLTTLHVFCCCGMVHTVGQTISLVDMRWFFRSLFLKALKSNKQQTTNNNHTYHTTTMAARKSCTHLTWAEAKAKTGQASVGGTKKNKQFLRKQDHGQVLAAKVIAKHHGGHDAVETKRLEKAYRKQEEKMAAKAAERQQLVQEKRRLATQQVRPYERAQERLAQILHELQEQGEDKESSATLDNAAQGIEEEHGVEALEQIAECRQMQVDEIMALQAMMEQDKFVLSKACQFTQLQEKLEQRAYDENDQELCLSIAQHPSLSFYMLLHVDDDNNVLAEATETSMTLNATLILRVSLPPFYLRSSETATSSPTPHFDFIQVMVTDKQALCSADKPLESLAWLDETAILDAMTLHAKQELLPYPCVYELAETWLSEHLFEYLKLQPGVLTTK